MRRGCAGLAVALAVLVLGAGMVSTALAAKGGGPGTVDPSFGHGGKVFAKMPAAVAPAGFGAAAIEANGDLLVEIHRESGLREAPLREIERRLPDGSLDPSFGKGGRARVGVGSGLALLPDGSILVSVTTCGPGHGSMVLLDATGVRETAFGTEGCGPALEFPAEFIAPAPDGSIFLAGSHTTCGPCGKNNIPHDEPFVAKLRPDGTLDPSFGKAGVVHVDTDLGVPLEALETRTDSGLVATASGGAVLATGKLLLGLGPDGALSSSFGKGGEVEPGGFSRALAALPEGKLAVATLDVEYSFQSAGQITVDRLLADGTPDPSFGNGGATQLTLPEEASPARLAAAPGGAVLVAGRIEFAAGCHADCRATLFLARLGSDGRLDPGYGVGGVAEVPPPPGVSAYGIEFGALLPTPTGGAIVTGGLSPSVAFAVATGPSGAPDPSFGEGGTVVAESHVSASLEPSGLALGPTGVLTVAAEGTSGETEYGGHLIGFRADGKQLPGAGGDGISAPTGARGRIVATRGGFVSWSEDMELRAVGPGGAPLSGWGQEGSFQLPKGFQPTGLDPGPGGGATVVGSVGHGAAMAVLRLGPRGRPVPGFGDRGLAKVSFGSAGGVAYAATGGPDGSTYLSGAAGGRTAVAKLLPSGRLDRRFGRGGKVTGLLGEGTFGGKVATFAGGVVVGSAAIESPETVAGVVRLDSRGHRVRGFGPVRPPATGRLLGLFAKRGRIVVVTDNEFARHSRGGVELRAYRADGSLDPSFGDSGLATGGVGQPRFFHPIAAVQQPNGKIVVAGAAWDGELSQVELLRFR